MFKLNYFCISDIGKRRDNNQDNYLCVDRIMATCARHSEVGGVIYVKKPTFLGIFDGMGGEQCGEKAAEISALTAKDFAINKRCRYFDIYAYKNGEFGYEDNLFFTFTLFGLVGLLYFSLIMLKKLVLGENKMSNCNLLKCCATCGCIISSGNDSPRSQMCKSCFKKFHINAGKASETTYWHCHDYLGLCIFGQGNVEYLKNTIDKTRESTYDPHNLGLSYEYPTFNDCDANYARVIYICNGIKEINASAIFSNVRNIVIAPMVTFISENFVIRNTNNSQHDVKVKGVKGSYAEKYAEEHSLLFESIDITEIPFYIAKVTPIPAQHYWGCSMSLLKNQDVWKIKFEDMYARDRMTDDTVSSVEILPTQFPNIGLGEITTYINSKTFVGPTISEKGITRCIKRYELEPLIKVANQVTNVRLNFNFSSIEEAATHSTLENIRPGGLSKYSADAIYLKTLFKTNRAEKGWGVSEEVVVDKRDNKAYWIVTQYDGQICSNTWYLHRKPLTYSDVQTFARDESEELFQKFQGVTEENWRDKLKSQ